MKRWQYKLVHGSFEEVEAKVNELAQDEWEPVGFSAHGEGLVCLLKRKRSYAQPSQHRSPWHRAA